MKNGRGDDNEEDHETGQDLWRRYTRDIARISPANVGRDDEGGQNHGAAAKAVAAEKKVAKDKGGGAPTVLLGRLDSFEAGLQAWDGAGVDEKPGAASAQIDKRTALRLKRGQMPIDARIDLHGLYQTDARLRLCGFIEQSFHRGLRCVLVITGKGQLVFEGEAADANTPGVIKRNFKTWLRAEPYASMILKIEKAQIKDGGEGAYYILLRRTR